MGTPLCLLGDVCGSKRTSEDVVPSEYQGLGSPLSCVGSRQVGGVRGLRLMMMETRWSPVDEPAAGSSETVLWKLIWAESPVWYW